MKGVLCLRPIRMWLEENVKAHVMICYLAYTLLMTFRCLLKKNGEKTGVSNISIEDAIEELANVYRVYFHKESGKDKDGSRNVQ